MTYIRVEMSLVRRERMIFQAWGAKLTVEQRAARKPMMVAIWGVMAEKPAIARRRSALHFAGLPHWTGAGGPLGCRHDSRHVPHQPRRERACLQLHPRLGSGRTECQQGLKRRPAALRRAQFAVAPRKREAAAGAAGRAAADVGWRAGADGAAVSQPRAQPRGCDRPPERTDPSGGNRAEGAAGDEADAGLEAAAPGREDPARRPPGPAPVDSGIRLTSGCNSSCGNGSRRSIAATMLSQKPDVLSDQRPKKCSLSVSVILSCCLRAPSALPRRLMRRRSVIRTRIRRASSAS